MFHSNSNRLFMLLVVFAALGVQGRELEGADQDQTRSLLEEKVSLALTIGKGVQVGEAFTVEARLVNANDVEVRFCKHFSSPTVWIGCSFSHPLFNATYGLPGNPTVKSHSVLCNLTLKDYLRVGPGGSRTHANHKIYPQFPGTLRVVAHVDLHNRYYNPTVKESKLGENAGFLVVPNVIEGFFMGTASVNVPDKLSPAVVELGDLLVARLLSPQSVPPEHIIAMVELAPGYMSGRILAVEERLMRNKVVPTMKALKRGLRFGGGHLILERIIHLARTKPEWFGRGSGSEYKRQMIKEIFNKHSYTNYYGSYELKESMRRPIAGQSQTFKTT